MSPEQINAILSPATPAQLGELHKAHWRYMSLVGMVSDVILQDTVASDRKAYPQFVKSESGMVVFNDSDCVTFMAEVTGLSTEFCEAWKNYDYYVLHGETVHEAVARDGV